MKKGENKANFFFSFLHFYRLDIVTKHSVSFVTIIFVGINFDGISQTTATVQQIAFSVSCFI